MSPFEPESEKRERKQLSVFPLFRSESVSESPEGARHGTATGPARAERKRVVGSEREASGREGSRRRGGGNLDRIRSPVSAVATTGGLFARLKLLSEAAPRTENPERTGSAQISSVGSGEKLRRGEGDAPVWLRDNFQLNAPRRRSCLWWMYFFSPPSSAMIDEVQRTESGTKSAPAQMWANKYDGRF